MAGLPTETKTARPRMRRFAIFAVLAAVVGYALWAGPSAGLRFALFRGLETLGYRVIELADARVSLLDRRIDIGGLRIEGPGSARIEAAGIEILPGELFSGRVVVPALRVEGLALDLERTASAWRLSGFEFAAGRSGPAISDGPAWRIGQLDIVNSRLIVHDGVARVPIDVATARIENIDPKSGASASFVIEATLDGRRIDMSGTAVPFADVPQADAHVRFEGVRIAPVARLAGLKLDGTLDFNGDMRVNLADGATLTGNARVGDFRFDTSSAASATWSGAIDLAASGAVTASGKLSASRLRHSTADMKAEAAAAAFDGKLSVGDGATFKGVLSTSTVAIDSGGNSLAAASGRLEIASARVGSDGAISGSFAASFASPTIAGPDGRGKAAAVSASGDVTASAGTADFVGSVGINGVEVESPDFRFGAGSISAEIARLGWSGGSGQAKFVLTFDAPTANSADGRIDGERITFDGNVAFGTGGDSAADGELGATQLRVALARADAVAALDSLTFAGSATFGTEGPVLSGSLKASKLNVVDSTARELFAAAGLGAATTRFDRSGLSAVRVSVAEPRVLRREKAIEGREAFGWRLRAARAELEDFKIAASGASAVDTIRIANPVIRVTRTKNGFLSFERGAPPVADVPIQGPAPSPGLAIRRFEIVDGRAVFEDRAPHATVRVPVDRLALSVRDIDIGRPERPTALSLSARVGGFGQAKANGTVYPFDKRLSFDLEVALREVDLPMISPYFDDKLGVDVRTGTASVEGRIVARQEKLSGTTKWRLSNVRIDDREGGEGPVAAQAGAPVGTVLSLLADDENNISLEIPVSGELSNPDFDTADAVRQAVGGALRGALSNTLSVLFPFGSFISAAIDAERKGTGIVLPDVPFAPGQATLDADTSNVVDGLAKLLSARPAARLEVCGFAGPIDVPAIPRRPGGRPVDDDALRRLADRRAEAVKRRLVEGGGVDPSRIFECRAVSEDGADARPRAELRF